MAVKETLKQRGKTHGSYTDDATAAMQTVELWMSKPGWGRLDYVKKHALIMNAFKVARILTGDSEFKDHWHDMAGYATLAEERCDE